MMVEININELDLIRKAQAGDRRASGRLFCMHTGFLVSIAKRYGIPGYEFDDNLQLAAIGFLDAIKDFDLNADCKLVTLVFHKARKQFALKLTLFKMQKRSGETFSLDSPIDQDENVTLLDCIPTPENEPDQTGIFETAREVIKKIKKPLYRDIAISIVDTCEAEPTCTLSYVADMHGITKQYVSQLLKRVTSFPEMKKLRVLLKTE